MQNRIIEAIKESKLTKASAKERNQPRLELGCEELRIDDRWYPLPGEQRQEVIRILLSAPKDEWTSRKAIEALRKGSRIRAILRRLHPEVRVIIEGPRPGVGGYRIKPEYRI
jgi:hypothetical protein